MRSMSLFNNSIKSLIAVLLLAASAEARFATREDSAVEFAYYNSDVVIHADGSTIENVDYQIDIKNEHGRSGYAIQNFRYNGNIQTMEVLSASTILNGETFPVPKDSIEVKPLASEEQGFDQAYQVMVSYPNVVVGAALAMKYRLTTKQQPLPNYFAMNVYFGNSAYWRMAHIQVKSALPFNVRVNDPKKHLKIKETKKPTEQTLVIDLIQPDYTDMINEPGTITDNDKNTYVQLSTLDKFDPIGAELGPAYQTVIEQPLPPAFVQIRDEALKIKNPIDQINHITAALAEKVRYMGDWRTIDGKLKPRDLAVIAATGIGDCKDYSVSLASILRNLGYDAHTAVVFRGTGYYPPRKSLPSLGLFNHAIVHAVDAAGKEYWLDPTNFVSMAQGLFPDIANRPALILNPKAPFYTNISPIDAQHDHTVGKKQLRIGPKKGELQTEGASTLQGEAAMMVTGASLRRSEAYIKEALIELLSGEKDPIKKRIDLPSLKSRVVEDVTIGYGFDQEDATMTTNVGEALDLDGAWAAAILNTTEDQEGITFLGTPKSEAQTLLLAGVKAKDVQALNTAIRSPWFQYTRECKQTPEGVLITENSAILKSFITAAEVRSPEFQKLKKQVKQSVVNVAIVVE